MEGQTLETITTEGGATITRPKDYKPCRQCQRARERGGPNRHCPYCGRHHRAPGYHKRPRGAQG